MTIGCIVLAAGKGIRFSKNKSKLFHKIDGAPIVHSTLNNLLSVFTKKNLYITINKKITKKDKKSLEKYTENPLIIGGSTRYKSLKSSLSQIRDNKIKYIFIHDAARPNISKKLLIKIKKQIKTNKYDAVIPYLKIEGTLKKISNKDVFKTLDRDKFITTQTPQAFKLVSLKNNIDSNIKLITDDVQIIESKKNSKVKYILGEKDNLKITTKEDLKLIKSFGKKKYLIGNGFDIHRLKKGKFLSMAGLQIKSNYALVGHSDGDVVIHSLIDAILGSIGKGDIGEYFPSNDMKYLNISSKLLLKKILKIYNFNSKELNNIDITIICQTIRLSKYKKQMRYSLAEMLGCDVDKINIKAKTADEIGIIGNSKAIACWVSLIIND